jgi:hypothetical protein
MRSVARHVAVGVALLGAACARTGDRAVTCTVSYGGEARELRFPAVREPYSLRAVDIAGRFRFKVVYLTPPSGKSSIDVYVYHQGEAGDVILQETKRSEPFPTHGLTGEQLVYSPTARELAYSCELSR